MFYPTLKSDIAVNACFSRVGSSEFRVTIPLKRVTANARNVSFPNLSRW